MPILYPFMDMKFVPTPISDQHCIWCQNATRPQASGKYVLGRARRPEADSSTSSLHEESNSKQRGEEELDNIWKK